MTQNPRIHISLDVSDLASSISFYRKMFGREPSKVRSDWAKFEVEDPGLNLALNFRGKKPGRGALSHLGIEVGSSAQVWAAAERLERSGLEVKREEERACCYSTQDKVWATDPDGNRWETFVVLAPIERADSAGDAACCPRPEPSQAATTCCETSTGCC